MTAKQQSILHIFLITIKPHQQGIPSLAGDEKRIKYNFFYHIIIMLQVNLKSDVIPAFRDAEPEW